MHRVKPPLHWAIIGALTWVVGCGDRTPPVMSELTFVANPSGHVPLAARATVTTDEAAQAAVQISAGEHSWVQTATPAYQVEHSVMVLGLQPAQTYQIVFVATDEAGNEVRSSAYETTTPALPEDFPPIEAARSEPERMEPGVTLFSVYRRTEDDLGTDFGLILAVNVAGGSCGGTTARTSGSPTSDNGNILYTGGAKRDRMYEIDMLGHMIRRWHPPPMVRLWRATSGTGSTTTGSSTTRAMTQPL